MELQLRFIKENKYIKTFIHVNCCIVLQQVILVKQEWNNKLVF